MKSVKSAAQRTNEDELFKIMGDKSPVGVCIIQDGKFCYLNSNFPLAIGYTADELVDKDPLELIVPEDREMARENEIKMLKGELIPPYQFRVIHKDGSIRWVMETVRSVQYHGRRAVLGNYMEVTERKQAEDALKESGEKYRELANSITDVFFAMDEHLRYTYWNKASEILTGIRTEDAIGKSLREIFPDTPGVRKAEKVYRNVLKTQQPQAFVNDMDIDGRHYIFEISAYPSRGGISVFVNDITERKQAEEQLKESEQKYRLLFETSPDCIAQIDREGRFLAANPASAKSLGVPLEELIGKTSFEVQPQEVAQYRLKMVRKTLDEWQPEIFEDERAGRYFHHIVIPMKSSEQKEVVQVITRDITERRQAVEALRQSEERYRTILEEMEDSYFEVDLGGHLTFVNNSVCRDLGFSKEELIGMSYKDFVAEDDIESLFRVFNEVYRTGVPNKGFPWRTIRKNGSQGFAETSISLLKGDKGEIIGFRGVGRDITERKKTEEKLRQSEERYRALFDNTAVGTVVIDPNTMKVTMANQAAARMLGFGSVEAATRVDPLDFVSPEDRERVHGLIVKDLFEQDSRQTHELPMITKDGREIWISVQGTRITQENGLAGLLSFTDVTERKQMAEALKLAAEQWTKTFDSISDAVSIHDKDFRILRANKAFAGLFQKSLHEIMGMHCYELHKGNKPRSGCPHQHTLATGKPSAAEFYESHLKRYLLESTSPIFNEQGEPVGTVHITRDITEQKRQNERLMMTDRLASLGELAAGTAHELNNPLTSIIGFSQLLLEKEVPDDIREDLKLINTEAQRAANVTKNLLTFARKHAPVKQRSNINNTIEDVLKLRAYEHKANGINVERELAPNLPEIMVDYFQMQQVFLNIIINAEYFMTEAHKGGTLTIATRRHNDSVVISFADDGPGIPPGNVERIFDPFFTTKEAGRGTGLGLSICHGIVTEHRGQIYAMSQQDKGATIVVELPINNGSP
jgi:PAS domain S-box-containing protein